MSVITKVVDTYAAMRARFHGGNVHGQPFKDPPDVHSLGGRGGPHDANGNRIDKNGRVIGRDAAFYPVTNSTNRYTRKPMGAWLR